MKDLLHEPVAAWILAGTIVSFLMTRTPFAKWSLVVATLVLLASAEVACFDGKRHLTKKFDATFFVWGRAVELRAVVGAAFVLLGGPLVTVGSKLVGRNGGGLLGVTALGLFGLGLLASSIALQISMRTILV
jgi:hypothetical protein